MCLLSTVCSARSGELCLRPYGTISRGQYACASLWDNLKVGQAHLQCMRSGSGLTSSAADALATRAAKSSERCPWQAPRAASMTSRSTCFSEIVTSFRYSRANSTCVLRPSVSSSDSDTTSRG